jgi:predicted PurR-regulated permease PerM
MARPRHPTRAPRFVLLASICVIVAALYFAQDVLIPLALAILVSFLLAPLVRRLERLGLPRVVSVIVVMTVVITLVAGLGYLVYSQVVDLANELPRYEQNIRQKVARVTPGRGGMFEKVRKAAEELSRAAEAPATQPTQPTQPTTTAAVDVAREAAARVAGAKPPPASGAPATQPSGTEANPLWVITRPPVETPLRIMQEYLAKLLPPLGTAGIVLVFVIFMLIAREDMRDRMIRLIGHGQINLTTQAVDDAATRISRYLLMQMIVNGTYGLAIAIGLWLIGVPSPALWGLLCCVLRFIPYVGPWIAAAFPLALALASFPGFRQFVYAGLLFIVIELLSNNAMEPWLYGASTGMSTVAVIVSAVFWTWLWGPIGLVMATPLTVCLVVLGKYVPQLKFLDILLGDEPVLAPSERVYQRLLAGDPEEAEELLDEYLANQSLEEVYDQVLLPALAMAEHDAHRGRLDEDRSLEIHRSVRQLAEELAAQEKSRELRRAADRTIARARGEQEEAAAAAADTAAADDAQSQLDRPSRPRLPEDRALHVVLLPAHDEADEIVGLMLGQLLDLRGYHAVPVSQTALASEMLDRVEKEHADIVVVSALPPASVAHARYLCKRLTARFPEMAMAVGLWTVRTDMDRARKRIACSDAVLLATTLTTALEQIRQLAQPKLLQPEGTESRSPSPAGRGQG